MKKAWMILAFVLFVTSGCMTQNRSSQPHSSMLNQGQSVSDAQKTPTATAAPEVISVNEAKQIALNYFDQNEQNVVFEEIKTVLDDGRTVIEIELNFDHKRFEIEIDAATGAVLEVDEEKSYPSE